MATGKDGMKYSAYVLEECGIPWLIGTYKNRADAQLALDDLQKITVPSTEQIWFYIREHD